MIDIEKGHIRLTIKPATNAMKVLHKNWHYIIRLDMQPVKDGFHMNLSGAAHEAIHWLEEISREHITVRDIAIECLERKKNR